MLSLKESIYKRKSIRNYDNREIEEEKIKNIINILDKFSSEEYKLVFVKEEKGFFKGFGTYGVIKDAKYYILVLVNKSIKKDKEKLIEFGKNFESVIIEMTKLGLGTCWMAGTFNKSTFGKYVDDKFDDILIVSPLGYDKGKKRLIEKGIALLINSKNRKDFNKIFFDENLVGLREEEELLNMLRMAPSAVNRQPWRVIKEEGIYHLFGDKSSYKDNLVIFYIDMGIAKAHIEFGGECLNLKGKWVEEDKIFREYEYMGSYKY